MTMMNKTKTMNLSSFPDEVNVIKSYNDYDTLSDSESDSDSDSETSYSDSSDSDSIDSDCERDMERMIDHFSNLGKTSERNPRVVHTRYEFEGIDTIANDSNSTAMTFPISSIHTPPTKFPKRARADTMSTDCEDFHYDTDCDGDFREDQENENESNDNNIKDDDGYDYDELFDDGCDDNSMYKFLLALHKAPGAYRASPVAIASVERKSPVQFVARKA